MAVGAAISEIKKDNAPYVCQLRAIVAKLGRVQSPRKERSWEHAEHPWATDVL